MHQLSTLGLIRVLLWSLIRRGNLPVYYHGLPPCSLNAPMEVEWLELRDTSSGPKLTIR